MFYYRPVARYPHFFLKKVCFYYRVNFRDNVLQKTISHKSIPFHCFCTLPFIFRLAYGSFSQISLSNHFNFLQTCSIRPCSCDQEQVQTKSQSSYKKVQDSYFSIIIQIICCKKKRSVHKFKKSYLPRSCDPKNSNIALELTMVVLLT